MQRMRKGQRTCRMTVVSPRSEGTKRACAFVEEVQMGETQIPFGEKLFFYPRNELQMLLGPHKRNMFPKHVAGSLQWCMLPARKGIEGRKEKLHGSQVNFTAPAQSLQCLTHSCNALMRKTCANIEESRTIPSFCRGPFSVAF